MVESGGLYVHACLYIWFFYSPTPGPGVMEPPQCGCQWEGKDRVLFHLNWTAIALHIGSLLKQFRESLFVSKAKICSEIISCQFGMA